MSVLSPGDPDRLLGEHIWQLDLLEYEATCELLNGLAGLAWDREQVEVAVLARTWRDLRPERPATEVRSKSPTKPTKLAADLLAIGERLGWPEFSVWPHLTIMGGEQHWRQFSQFPPPGALEAALEAVKRLMGEDGLA